MGGDSVYSKVNKCLGLNRFKVSLSYNILLFNETVVSIKGSDIYDWVIVIWLELRILFTNLVSI